MTLNCNFRYLKDLEDSDKEIYTCESINFTNRVQNVHLNYVTNMHEMGRRDRDVKVFIIKQQICHFLPLKIENFFPQLQELEVDSSGLKKLYRENFAPLDKLTMAIFPGNEIEFLPGDLFAYNQRITHIDFSQNRIKSIGRDLFATMYSLKYLVFDDNECYQGFGLLLEEVEVVRDEILKNCSTAVRQEKRITVRIDEPKVEVKKKDELKKEEKKSDERKAKENQVEPRPNPTMRYDEPPRHVTSRSTTHQVSLEIVTICCHLHVFATLCREMKIKF